MARSGRADTLETNGGPHSTESKEGGFADEWLHPHKAPTLGKSKSAGGELSLPTKQEGKPMPIKPSVSEPLANGTMVSLLSNQIK